MTDSGVRVVCAWCGRVVSEGSGSPVSHGICPPCAAAIIERLPRHLRDRFEGEPPPSALAQLQDNESVEPRPM